MTQSDAHPRSDPALVVGSSVKGVVGGEVLALDTLVLASVAIDVVSDGTCASAAGGIVVRAVSVLVRVAVSVLVRVSVAVPSAAVVVSVSVPVRVAVSVLVGMAVAVAVLVLGIVVVDGQPNDSCLQHQAFQSGVHAHSQMSRSAWQS